MFRPGEVWLDTAGNPIQAHSAGILYDRGIYYWFGEHRGTQEMQSQHPEIPHFNVIGVSCYSSRDLYNWQYEGLALPVVLEDEQHDLFPANVIERPKVIYNERTATYVMWMHIDRPDYQYARTGIAISATPAGPYHYLGSINPLGNDSRDMTLFKDTDGTAYLVCSTDMNRNTTIIQLAPDYLSLTERHLKTLRAEPEHSGREAPAVFRYHEHYMLVTSGCTGWAPNAAEWATSGHMLEEWTTGGDPCEGPDAAKTFYAQSTFILPVAGKEDAFIFLADRWKQHDLSDSRYVWLPLFVREGRVVIPWYDQWDLSIFA